MADDRPHASRWTVSWWVAANPHDLHGQAGLATFRDEQNARQTARDWTTSARRWWRAEVRLWREVRSVHAVRGDRGTRWECGRWQTVEEDVSVWGQYPDDVQVPLLETTDR